MKESHSWTDRVLDHLLEVGEVRGETRRTKTSNGGYATALHVLTEQVAQSLRQHESVVAAGDPLHGAYCLTRAAVDTLEDLALIRVQRAQGGRRAAGNHVERITLLR